MIPQIMQMLAAKAMAGRQGGPAGVDPGTAPGMAGFEQPPMLTPPSPQAGGMPNPTQDLQALQQQLQMQQFAQNPYRGLSAVEGIAQRAGYDVDASASNISNLANVFSGQQMGDEKRRLLEQYHAGQKPLAGLLSMFGS